MLAVLLCHQTMLPVHTPPLSLMFQFMASYSPVSAFEYTGKVPLDDAVFQVGVRFIVNESVPRPDGGVLHDFEAPPTNVTAELLERFVVRYQYSRLAMYPSPAVAVTSTLPSWRPAS